MIGYTRGRLARHVTWLAALATVALAGPDTRAQEPGGVTLRRASDVRLVPTVHPPIPVRPVDFWFVPDLPARSSTSQADSPAQRLARGVNLIDEGAFAAGLPLVSAPALAATPLADYARYFRGVALAGLDRPAEAEETFNALVTSDPEGYLAEASRIRLSETLLARGDARRALAVLDDLRRDKGLTKPDDVWLRLGRAAEAAGDTERALEAYRKVYYGSPLGQEAVTAQSLLAPIDKTSLPDRLTLELVRGERLFAARRWAQARAGFAPLLPLASGDDRDLVALRLAECDYYLNRFRASRDALTPLLSKPGREAEARYFYLSATRGLKDVDAYLAQARALVADAPDSPWTIETLNDLASYYVRIDDNEAADGAFRDLVRRFPDHRYGERAAWKIGWWAYKNARFAEAAEAFERGAATFKRADFRPAWLYWAGRARDQAGDAAGANERYRVAVADYQNSYYGRLASKILDARRVLPAAENVSVASAAGGMRVPTAALIRELVGLGLYEAAIKELEYAQRAWGDSPAIQATVAWVRHAQAPGETAPERFDHLRGAITVMKRAYPQYLASGGENLPPEVLGVIFPLDYWPLIKKYSDADGLDPYLMAALIAQESTFTADVRSSANAWGLMQLLPTTGRRYAQRIGVRPFSTASLKRPETNIRLGMTYFKDLMTRFGGAHFALAGYNAGEGRVVKWQAERPGFSQDEFIDDIPFPETQNYVKRILGTAEDYRRLYGGGLLAADIATPTLPARATR